ncbi:hypothetical protein [Sphingobium sp. AP50]|uniref:hypothetical protein n=1 Tax=Sphingobium sp. AP50 TaxID=1884369 RepID=UPI0011606912|nr:hypothetical protein [Sphingobium sp. AP50]
MFDFMTGSEASDYRAVSAGWRSVARAKALSIDGGHEGDVVGENLLMHGILPFIPPKANRCELISRDCRRCTRRTHMWAFQAVLLLPSTKKTAISFANFSKLATICRWLPHFVNAARLDTNF